MSFCIITFINFLFRFWFCIHNFLLLYFGSIVKCVFIKFLFFSYFCTTVFAKLRKSCIAMITMILKNTIVNLFQNVLCRNVITNLCFTNITTERAYHVHIGTTLNKLPFANRFCKFFLCSLVSFIICLSIM